MFRLIGVGAALAAMAAMAATAQAPSDTRGKNEVKADPNQVICRNQPVVGSRVNQIRVCRTRAEWADSRSESRKGGDRRHNRNARNSD